MTTTTATQVLGQQTSSTSSSSKTVLGKDDFLKLFLAQLRNQDPMNPMKGTEVATQLAQFSSVEQLSNINTNLTKSLDMSSLLSQSISNALSATLVGKEVKATGDSFMFNGSTEVRLGYTLPSKAENVEVTIVDANGTPVRTFKDPGIEKGDTTFTWDGKNDDGQALSQGKYTFKVNATDKDGNTLSSSSFRLRRGKLHSIQVERHGICTW